MDPTPDQVVAANARRLREDRGYSQARTAQLMTEAGYPTGEMPLWALENCRRRIKVSDLFGLAAALDVTPESFLSPGPAAEAEQPTVSELQQEISRLRAGEESGYTPEVEATPGQWLWRLHQAPAGERLEVIGRLLESSRRAEVCFFKNCKTCLSGDHARTSEPRLLDCGFCYEEQGEEVHPHPECPVGKSDAPLVAFARIGLHVEPGFAGGVTAASWSKDAILSDADSALMPDVDIKGAQSLSLKGSRQVFAGDEQAQIFVDGRRYTTSSEHPVIVEPFGPGMDGAFVTLTLIADKVTVDGKEISE